MVANHEYSIGCGGWVRYRSSRSPTVVFVRFEDRAGRLSPVELFLEALGGSTLDTDALRDVPLGLLDGWVNGPDSAQQVRARLGVPGPDLKRAARTWTTQLSAVQGKLRRDHWLDDMYWSQVEGSGVPLPPLPAIAPLAEVPEAEVRAMRDADLDLARLTVPTHRPFGDDFYRSVATAYTALSKWTWKPAAVIADETGVPVVRVHKWVRVARERGYLGPAHHGKAG